MDNDTHKTQPQFIKQPDSPYVDPKGNPKPRIPQFIEAAISVSMPTSIPIPISISPLLQEPLKGNLGLS